MGFKLLRAKTGSDQTALKREVAASLQRIADGTASAWELQEIIDLQNTKDLQLRGVAITLNWLQESFSTDTPAGAYCNKRGTEVIRLMAEELSFSVANQRND